MKVILFVFGLWFIHWNWCGLSENLSAIWHFIVLLIVAVVLILWIFHEAYNWLLISR